MTLPAKVPDTAAPDKATADKAAPADPPRGEPFADADKATEETRGTAKWLITTLAATAGVIYGAGPIITQPKLDWSDSANRWQLIIAAVCGALGIVATITLIVLISRILQPSRITLSSLPPDTLTKIEKEPEIYLPAKAVSVADLRKRLGDYVKMSANLEGQVATFAREVADGEPKPTLESQRRLRYAEQQAAITKINLTAYQTAAQRILDEAQYIRANDLFSGWERVLIGAAAVIAALGGLAFNLTLAAPAPTDDKADDTPIAAGTIAYLPIPVTDAQKSLFDSLNLDQAARPDGTVAVKVDGGSGTEEDPWTVTTICLDLTDCGSQRFSLLANVYPVLEFTPTEVTVTYTPAATASESSTQSAGR